MTNDSANSTLISFPTASMRAAKILNTCTTVIPIVKTTNSNLFTIEILILEFYFKAVGTKLVSDATPTTVNPFPNDTYQTLQN